VLEHDVGKLVCDVAVLAAEFAQWIDDNDLATVNIESRCREGEGLDSVELLKVCNSDELTRINDGDLTEASKIARV
jgi:hypothetical protein